MLHRLQPVRASFQGWNRAHAYLQTNAGYAGVQTRLDCSYTTHIRENSSGRGRLLLRRSGTWAIPFRGSHLTAQHQPGPIPARRSDSHFDAPRQPRPRAGAGALEAASNHTPADVILVSRANAEILDGAVYGTLTKISKKISANSFTKLSSASPSLLEALCRRLEPCQR